MAVLRSKRGDVSFELKFLKDAPFFKVDTSKPDVENWLPVIYKVIAFEESYSVISDINPTLNLFEVKNMLDKFKHVINAKISGANFNRVEISTYEFYYEIELFDPNEEDEVGVTIWLFEATRTNGELNGFDRGFRFYVSLEVLISFTNHLEQEIITIM